MSAERKSEAGSAMPMEEAGLAGVLSAFARHSIQGAIERVRVWHERRALKRELCELDDSALADLGLSRSQIPYLVKAHPKAAGLLAEMLARLGLDKDELLYQQGTHEDLYRTCIMCRERRQCERWLAGGKTDEGYRVFCPNAPTLYRLVRARIAAASGRSKAVH
jgi:uncharacterized protein YjiS (DUF1127 family)